MNGKCKKAKIKMQSAKWRKQVAPQSLLFHPLE